MRIKLTREMPIDGLTFGAGSEVTLGPDYAMALVERGDAVPVKPEAERAVVGAPETATPRKRRARKVETPEGVKG